ncbi:hypothetical protein OHC33_005397 [Knufia fluminis]|uniref:Xylanolytic transcriptional activator regulatory domain-containing protein n=1 Tax=Knufia fluminis TaxID=191047 RepID=A0AAN8EKE7_9EURO|nr:hypothetical protein OHC33_005397 [Knufia fluminis]
MTPRSQSSPGTLATNVTHDTDSKTPANDDPDQQEETRPPHTAEIGTLKKLSVPGGTAWLGSSSGVYFVNTVRRAFSAAFASQSNTSLEGGSDPADDVPASEDIITGEDASGRNVNGSTTNGAISRNSWWLHDQDFHRRIIAAVGRPPADQKLAMDLVTTFFRQTHPLFPFLHGPKFLEDMNEIYTAISAPSKQPPQQPTKAPQLAGRRTNSATSINSTSNMSTLGNIHSIDPLKLITFQIIINIAALSNGTSTTNDTSTNPPTLPPTSTIPSSQSLLTLILPLSTTPLLPTIQLLLSAELYLLSTISLRHSSTLAGIVLRQIYHIGLHRCPLRYASLTPSECEIRKRVFWSAYALDRHLSLALGDPNTFQDSDIDVCLSRNGGEGEMHRAVARELLSEEEREHEVRLHFPRDAGGRVVNMNMVGAAQGGSHQRQRGSVNVNMTDANATAEAEREKAMLEDDPRTASEMNVSNRGKQLREAALTAYVHYGKLTGRIIEIFHKSINFRFPKEDAIGFLTADIENWWNDLPSTLTGEFNPATSSEELDDIEPGLVEQHKLLTPFFTVLYHQLLLLLNRPRLSLDQSTAEFQQGLQVCIRTSRNTLSALKKHKENGQSMFLPGLLSAAWMSGLIIAFACQLGKYPKTRACSDIKSCLLILESMNVKWYTVKNCHKVLSLLLTNITTRKTSSNGYLQAGRNDQIPHAAGPTRKRTRDSISVDNSEAEPSPKRDSLAGISPASSDFRPPHFRSPDMRSNSAPGHHNNIGATASFARQDSAMSTASTDFSNPSSHLFRGMNLNNFSPSNTGADANNSQHRAGAAIYADPQDMAFAQSSHSMGLPELSSMDDQMFWGNMDSNLFDVFGAVSWETMTGPVGPMASNPGWEMSAFANSGGGNGNDTAGNGRYM